MKWGISLFSFPSSLMRNKVFTIAYPGPAYSDCASLKSRSEITLLSLHCFHTSCFLSFRKQTNSVLVMYPNNYFSVLFGPVLCCRFVYPLSLQHKLYKDRNFILFFFFQKLSFKIYSCVWCLEQCLAHRKCSKIIVGFMSQKVVKSKTTHMF